MVLGAQDGGEDCICVEAKFARWLELMVWVTWPWPHGETFVACVVDNPNLTHVPEHVSSPKKHIGKQSNMHMCKRMTTQTNPHRYQIEQPIKLSHYGQSHVQQCKHLCQPTLKQKYHTHMQMKQMHANSGHSPVNQCGHNAWCGLQPHIGQALFKCNLTWFVSVLGSLVKDVPTSLPELHTWRDSYKQDAGGSLDYPQLEVAISCEVLEPFAHRASCAVSRICVHPRVFVGCTCESSAICWWQDIYADPQEYGFRADVCPDRVAQLSSSAGA